MSHLPLVCVLCVANIAGTSLHIHGNAALNHTAALEAFKTLSVWQNGGTSPQLYLSVATEQRDKHAYLPDNSGKIPRRPISNDNQLLKLRNFVTLHDVVVQEKPGISRTKEATAWHCAPTQTLLTSHLRHFHRVQPHQYMRTTAHPSNLHFHNRNFLSPSRSAVGLVLTGPDLVSRPTYVSISHHDFRPKRFEYVTSGVHAKRRRG